MQVWLVEGGEDHEGGMVIGVYADRELAVTRFRAHARDMAFGPGKVTDLPHDGLRAHSGCDWLELVAHDVIEQ